MLKAMGYPVFSADACSSHLTDSDEAVRKALSDLLGSEIFALDGTLEKKRMSEIIFNNPGAREAVNGIIHPAVWHSFEKWCDKCMAHDKGVLDGRIASVSGCDSESGCESGSGDGPKLLFLESAIIFECGWGDRFDYTICVTADEETRIQRAVARSKGQNDCSASASGVAGASVSTPTMPRVSQCGMQREEQSPLTAEEVRRRIQNQMSDAEKIRLATYTIHTDDDQSELSQLLAILDSLRSKLH